MYTHTPHHTQPKVHTIFFVDHSHHPWTSLYTVLLCCMLYLYHRLECFAWYIRTRLRAAHKCLWYKCYVPHFPCRLIARQYEVEIRIYYIDRLRNSIMGRHMQAGTTVIPERANPMESVESSYKQLNSCFVAIASFQKVYYTSKGLTFFLK